MRTIPYIDIRQTSPVHLVENHVDQARALINASHDTVGLLSKALSVVILPLGDHYSKKWLIKTGNPYNDEIDQYVNILRIRGVYALNLCYEWGCTSGAYNKGESVVLTRVLDWAFPALGENTVVAHQTGQAGDFYNVTWPGMSGIYNAMAPGRFAAAINQAPMRRHNKPFVLDWWKNRLNMREAAGLPPSHLLRKVFETAADYQEAKRMLKKEEIALPVTFVLTGTKAGEGCVIERTEKDAEIREIRNGRVCAANHFESRFNEIGYGWRARPIDSQGRMRLANRLSVDEIKDDFRWFKKPIANSHTRLVMMADAAAGKLSVMGTAGEKPVTEVFRL